MPSAAAIYCRLSQDRTGAGVVVERQERECRQLADALGWTVGRVYRENDVSAYRKKPREQYQALLAALEAGEVDGVLTWHTDRLHRSPRELEGYIDVCEPRGIVTRTVRAGELDLATPSGRMVARSLGAVARYESEQTAARTRAGKADAASRGEWSGGPRIFGYEVVPAAERPHGGSALRLVPAEAEVVRTAARRVRSGESLRSLARSLNEAGHRTARGGLWSGSALRKVLVRPATAGLRASGGEAVARGNWNPLLDEDEWRGLVALLSDPARRTTDRFARTYLGSGLYLCGVCGGKLTGNTTAGGGPGDRRPAYRCRTVERGGVSHVVRSVGSLDSFVTSVLAARLSRPDARSAMAVPEVDTAPLYTEADGLRLRLDEAARGWAAGALTRNQLVAATKELRGRLEVVEERLGEANRKTVLGELPDTPDARAALDAMSLDRRRAVLELLAVITVLPREHSGRLAGGGYFDATAIDVRWKTDSSDA